MILVVVMCVLLAQTGNFTRLSSAFEPRTHTRTYSPTHTRDNTTNSNKTTHPMMNISLCGDDDLHNHIMSSVSSSNFGLWGGKSSMCAKVICFATFACTPANKGGWGWEKRKRERREEEAAGRPAYCTASQQHTHAAVGVCASVCARGLASSAPVVSFNADKQTNTSGERERERKQRQQARKRARHVQHCSCSSHSCITRPLLMSRGRVQAAARWWGPARTRMSVGRHTPTQHTHTQHKRDNTNAPSIHPSSLTRPTVPGWPARRGRKQAGG